MTTEEAKSERALYTSGPWTVAKAKYPQDGEYDYAIECTVDGVRYVIAESFGRVSENIRIPAEANARLIASAPDLIEALREAREALGLLIHYEDHDADIEDGTVLWERVLVTARASLAKIDAALAKVGEGE